MKRSAENPPATERSDPQRCAAASLLKLYHKAAEGLDGVLVLGTVNPSEEKPDQRKKAPYLPQKFRIGDVEGMAAEAVARSALNNVYFAPAVLRKDLQKR